MSNKKTYSKPFFYSCLLHLTLLLVLVVSFYESRPFTQAAPKTPTIVHATAVSEQQLQKELDQRAAAEKARQDAIKKATEEKARKERVRLAAIKKAKLAAERKKAIAIAKKKAVAKKQAEEKRKAALAKKQAQQKAIEEDFQKQLAAEGKTLKAQRLAQLQGIVDKYRGQIIRAISRHWIIPENANKQLQAELLIQLAPGGTVVNVKLLKSSGNAALDQSAISAVYKASPLPVPKEANLFEPFRELRLTVRPGNKN